jgi:hypothetical protein
MDSTQFDSLLATTLTNLKSSLNVNIYQLDVLSTFNDILANPSNYGFTNVTQPAYNGSTTVSDPDHYLFWDGKHPTRVGHQLLANAGYDLITTHNWRGVGTASWSASSNWDPAGAPASDWLVKLTNTSNAPESAIVSSSSSVRRVIMTSGAQAMHLVIQSGATLSVSADVQIGDQLDLQGGNLNCGSLQLVSSASSLIGEGGIVGNLANAGSLSPGHSSAGTISITGNYTQQAGSALAIDLADVTPKGSDTIVVSGAASLTGRLIVSAINGFVPLPGESFRVLTYGSHTGDFTSVTNATAFAGLRFNRSYDATGLNLIASGLGGDANLDGTVDLTDFTFLAANFNLSNKTWLDGDFNGDHSVDLTDFTILASDFQQTTPPSSLVPEPGVCAGISILAAALRRRRAA